MRPPMPLKTVDQRLHYIDHLRGFMFIVMAIDHALHAYALNWKRFWFFRDYEGSTIFDGIYLHDQSIIMPMLFFIFGMFVIPSLLRRGLLGYLKERFFRLGIVYVLGVIFIVPMLSYPKYETYDEPGIGYFEFWKDIFFGERIQAGPYWVVHAILGFTLLLLIIYYIIPPLYKGISRFFKWCIRNPMAGYITFGVISSLIFGISDLIWGAPWWTNFGGLFSLQSARMIMYIVYFLGGSVLMNSGVLQDEEFMGKFANQWPKFLGLYVILAATYMSYSVINYEAAFNEVTRQFVADQGGWIQARSGLWSILLEYGTPVLLRTTLHGFLCMTQVLLLLSIFKKFFDTATPAWTSLARNGFGIFIIHDPIVVWMQYYLINVHIPIVVKFILCTIIPISLAWLISAKILLKIPIVERILSPKPKEYA
jgi:glucan biosynthesis protein C